MILELAGLLALGFASAVLAYLLGIGGGSLIVPILVVFFGYHVHEAVAVSLVVMVASSLSITSVNLLKNSVNIRLALFLESVAVFGAVAGAMISVNISGKVISAIFAAAMFVTAFVMWKKSEKETELAGKPEVMGEFDMEYLDASKGELRYYQVEKPERSMIVVFIAGVSSGMLGIGGGVFKVPAMNIISKVPIKAAAATSNFMICFTTAAGAVPYLLKGYFHPAAAGTMVLGALAGSKFATGRLSKVKSKSIRMLFVCFVIFVAIQMVYKAVN